VIAGAGGGEDEPETTPADLGVPTTPDSLGDRAEDTDRDRTATTEETQPEADVGAGAAPVTPVAPPTGETGTPGTPVTPGTEQLAPPAQGEGGGAVEPAPQPAPEPEPAPQGGEGGGAVAPPGN
jgi:hypothetical protein